MKGAFAAVVLVLLLILGGCDDDGNREKTVEEPWPHRMPTVHEEAAALLMKDARPALNSRTMSALARRIRLADSLIASITAYRQLTLAHGLNGPSQYRLVVNAQASSAAITGDSAETEAKSGVQYDRWMEERGLYPEAHSITSNGILYIYGSHRPVAIEKIAQDARQLLGVVQAQPWQAYDASIKLSYQQMKGDAWRLTFSNDSSSAVVQGKGENQVTLAPR